MPAKQSAPSRFRCRTSRASTASTFARSCDQVGNFEYAGIQEFRNSRMDSLAYSGFLTFLDSYSLRQLTEAKMFELKPLSKEAIPAALQRAERYRLLNEPAEAESICLDILQIEPENQAASITLLLALTDQFPEGEADAVVRAQEVLSCLNGE